MPERGQVGGQGGRAARGPPATGAGSTPAARAVVTYGAASSVRRLSDRNRVRPAEAGQGEADRRQDQVLRGDVRIGQEAVRRHAAGRQDRQQQTEDQHQDHPGDEGRQGQRDRVEPGQRGVQRPRGHPHPQQRGDHAADDGEQQRGTGQHQGVGQPGRDQVGDLATDQVRAPQVEGEHVAEPAEVLRDHRLVETEVVPDRRDRLRGGVRTGERARRITGHHPQDGEDQHRGREQHRDGRRQPAQQVPAHDQANQASVSSSSERFV